MTTYFATEPRHYVQHIVPSDEPAKDPRDRVVMVAPDGSKMHAANIVTGYKMVISEDEKTYDSFIQERGQPEWIAKSAKRPVDWDLLQSEVDACHLHL
jgi:hypothetical protein